MSELPFAEKINYWKTSKSNPDTWTDRAIAEIEKHGGRYSAKVWGRDPVSGREAIMILFEIGGDQFKIIWPVLPTKSKTDVARTAAKRQAATLLYHEVKSKCVSMRVKGPRAAFFEYLVLPDGRTTSQVAIQEIAEIPDLLSGVRQLGPGQDDDIVDGDFSEV